MQKFQRRPLYERGSDLEAEQAIIRAVAEVTGTEAFKLPIASHIDYMMADRDGLRAWVEVKRRRNPKARYPTFFLSLNKAMHGLTMAQLTGKPFFLAVQWDDTGPELLRVDSLTTLRIDRGGRTDRNDAQDVEPMAHWPVSLFRPLRRS